MITLESYLNLEMKPYFRYPYGSSQASTIRNEDEHIAVGNAAVSKLEKRHGIKYTMGNLLTTLYEASGVSMDWAKGVESLQTFDFIRLSLIISLLEI